MYPISEYLYNLYMQQPRQIVDITMQTGNETLHLTEHDVFQNSLTIDRYCMSGKTIELGSAVAAEMKLKLDNRDGKFDDVTFEGAELFVRVGIEYTAPASWDWISQFQWITMENFTWNQLKSGDLRLGDSHWVHTRREYVPCGYFTVDEPPRKLSTISLSALDRMVSFDKAFDPSSISFPLTVGALLEDCCEICNVPLYTQVNTLQNYDYVINSAPDEEDLTYRRIIQWIGEITGTCAYIDWDGKLRMEWYHATPTKISSAVRYTSDLYENDIEITGVQITDAEKNEYLSGTDAYALNITGNQLIQHDFQTLAASLYNSIGGLTYRAYSCTTRSMPHLYPLDKIAYVDKDSVSHDTIITHYTFKLNGRTSVAAKGQTNTNAGYASANPLTKREQVILEAMKQETNKQLESRQQAVLEMNEVISNSLGLYRTGVEQADGSTIYYYHNGSTLDNSNIIYTYRAGGFAWTDAWDGEDTVWQYGITKDGNAVLNMLSAYKISTDMLSAGCVTTEKLETSFIESIDDRFELVVKTSSSGSYSVNSAGIVAAINASGSTVQIHADKIYLNGQTIADAITAGSIVTGAIDVTNALGYSLLYASTYDQSMQIGGFTVARGAAKSYIAIGKSAYNDSNSGVYLGTDGIGLGSQTFYVTSAGYLHAINGYFEGTVSASEIIGGSILQESGNKYVRIQNMVESKNTTTGDAAILDNGKFYLQVSNNNYLTITYNEKCAYAKSWIQSFLGGVGIAANWEWIGDIAYISQGLYVTQSSGHLEGTWYNDSGGLVTSDANSKEEINPLEDCYLQLFDELQPKSFLYRNGKSGRRHTGFVVQDILQAMDNCGIPTENFAAVAYDGENDRWALRYDELIALCCAKIQQMDAEIKKLQERIA